MDFLDKILALLIPSDDELAALLTAAVITILCWEYVLKRPTRRWQGEASNIYSRVGSGAMAAGITVNFVFYGFIPHPTMPWPILALEAFVTTPAAHQILLIYGAIILSWALKKFWGIDINLKQAVTGSEKLRVKTIQKSDGRRVTVHEDYETDHAGGDHTVMPPKTILMRGERHEMAEEDGRENTDRGGDPRAAGPADVENPDEERPAPGDYQRNPRDEGAD